MVYVYLEVQIHVSCFIFHELSLAVGIMATVYQIMRCVLLTSKIRLSASILRAGF